jgi:thiol:disulfide interchange protein DsbC
MKSILTNLLVLCFASGAGLAQAATAIPDSKSEMGVTEDTGGTARALALANELQLIAVQKNLRLMYPKTRFEKISPTPLQGIYEVVMGRNVAFVEETGRFFIFGRLFDMEKQEDLTSMAQAQQAGEQAATKESPKLDFSVLPLEQAIKTVRGDGHRVMAVFSDPDCPYCKNLEQELVKLDDVTVYTFLMPLDQLHPGARAKSDAVWCSKDRAAAWAALMLEGKVPKKTKGCEAPHKVVQPLMENLGINGTPFLIAGDGRTMPGAAPAARLSAWLDNGTKPVARNENKGTQK